MALLSDDKIYKIIGKIGLLEPAALDNALKEAQSAGQDLAAYLTEKDLVRPEELGQLMAHELHVRFINLSQERIKPEILTLIPEIVARNQKVLAFAKDAEGLKVAMVNPFDLDFIKSLEKKTGDNIIPFLASEKDISDNFGLYKKSIQQEYASTIQKHALEAQGSKAEDIPVVRLVDDLLSYGYNNHASDIHIEPREKDIKVRFRIDGVLYDVLTLPLNILDIIVARIKILSKLRTDETRSAQDGKISTTVEGTKLDIRVSVIPITHGEKVVMRLLSSQGRYFSLEDLGMESRDLSIVNRAIHKPYGMILATGPTGSGKTTTLYAIVKILNSREVNICTIEDPVEYEIEGINQIQVNPQTNLTFAEGLRSLLRQDPNIIMVGEIRDKETAQISVNSAMTGHLVLSTLHTNDAATTLPRFLDMKIEPFLVASTVSVIIGQRLVRKICMKCISSYVLEKEEIENLKKEIEISKFLDTALSGEVRMYKGKGCDHCNQTGYEGRIGIYEVMEVVDNIKALILARADADALKKQAVANGMVTMMEDGFAKAIAGRTTLEEIMRVTKQ